MTTLDALHLRYDGPIPQWELDAARAGGVEKLRQTEIWQTIRLYEGMARDCAGTIRRLRAAGQQGTPEMYRARARYLWLHESIQDLHEEGF